MGNNIYNNEHGSKCCWTTWYKCELKPTINDLQLYKTRMIIAPYSVGR